jgi:hypothetical protein
MTTKMIDVWCETGATEIALSNSPAVQSPDTIRGGIRDYLSALNRVADGIYTRWIEGLRT